MQINNYKVTTMNGVEELINYLTGRMVYHEPTWKALARLKETSTEDTVLNDIESVLSNPKKIRKDMGYSVIYDEVCNDCATIIEVNMSGFDVECTLPEDEVLEIGTKVAYGNTEAPWTITHLDETPKDGVYPNSLNYYIKKDDGTDETFVHHSEVRVLELVKQYTYRVECIKYITVCGTDPESAANDAQYEAEKSGDYEDVIVDECAGISVYDPNTDEEYELNEFYEREDD